MALVVFLSALALDLRGDEIIVPNIAETTPGTGGYSTLLHADERSYQLVVGPEELTGMPAGSSITGITWRLPVWIVYPTWPGFGQICSFEHYDITLSTSLNPPGFLSTTYTDNIGPDAVMVREGPISFADDFFPGGALTPALNPFGEILPFTTPYIYSGENLLLTIRHTGSDCGSAYLDTVPSPYTQAIGVASYTQEDDWYPQGLIVMMLVFESGGPAVTFLRGDANADAAFDISDPVFVLSSLFIPGSDLPTCADAADANDDGAVDISDAVYALSALFIPGSPLPPLPTLPDCGADPTDDALDCASFAACP